MKRSRVAYRPRGPWVGLMMKTPVIALAGLTPALADAASVRLTVGKANAPGLVAVQIEPPGKPPLTVQAPATPLMTPAQKRDSIHNALQAAGIPSAPLGPDSLDLPGLSDGTKLSFAIGSTAEAPDALAVIGTTLALPMQSIIYSPPHDPNVPPPPFAPIDPTGQPAIFTAGIITDVGDLTVQVSAAELTFQTDGPIICQALFQKLAPQAPAYGAGINYAGERLDVFFDPSYTITQGGIIFGTTSQTPGCSGTVILPKPPPPPCPADVDGDGIVGQSDLGIVLAAYGTKVGEQGYDRAADINGDGKVGQEDLGEVLAHYGETCP
jgi:hypothetical protein